MRVWRRSNTMSGSNINPSQPPSVNGLHGQQQLHDMRITALESLTRQIQTDVATINAQYQALNGQIQNLAGQVQMGMQASQNTIQENQRTLIRLLAGTEDRIQRQLEPMTDLANGLRWTRRAILAIAGGSASVLIFLATYGASIEAMFVGAWHGIFGK